MNKPIPKNTDVMLVDIQYVEANKRENIPDVLYIVWKDLDTLEKNVLTIENPTVEIYFEKPQFRDHEYAISYQYLDKLNKTVVPYKNILDAIINDGGDSMKRRVSEIMQSKNYSELDELYKYRYVFGADFDIRALYRYYWIKSFDNDRPKPISKAFADIETDFLDVDTMSDPKTCPIDMVTLIDADAMKSYTFALVGRNYEEKDMTHMTEIQKAKELKRRQLHQSRLEQEEYLINHQEELQNEIHELFDDSYGVLDYNFYFYKDEAKMIVHLFQLINKKKYDFVCWWNMPFDVPYIYERSKVLGLDPRDLFCHPDFKVKNCKMKVDKFHFAIKNKTDFFFNTGYTNYICQERIYAATRKNQSELRSFALNYIGQKVVGDKKINYDEVGSIKYFSYRNYKKYFIYNIKDVLLQLGIEKRVEDINNYYETAYQSITPYDSVFKQTVRLRNIQYLDYIKKGMVPVGNQNKTPFSNDDEPDDEDDDDTSKKKKVGFEGALVGDPRLNLYTGINLYGNKPTNNIFNNAIDMDMTAFYPNTIIAMNIDPSTLIFKVIVNANQFENRGGDLKIHTITDKPMLPKEESDFHDDVAKECFDNFQTKNWLSTGKKWFNLPSLDDLYEKVKKELG